MVILDRAYEPLRLSGESSFTSAQSQSLWQLWSPNKVLGLTGIRAAYLIAPELNSQVIQTLEKLNQLAASWPIGSHGVTMLQAWTSQEVQVWISDSRAQLHHLKTQQIQLLAGLQGVKIYNSETNFFCIKADLNSAILKKMGVFLRDASSFGLEGCWRISVQTDVAQNALTQALKQALKS